jgi:thioredoxin reductase
MREVELAIVGAGPAGLSAAIEAAKAGVQTVVFDENSKAGGQLFKQIHKFFGSRAHQAGTRGIDIGRNLLQEVEKSGAELVLNAVVWGIFSDHRLCVTYDNKNVMYQAKKILLATGAGENVLAFPGWTLAGVMGAGAIQTMINVHRVLPGKRVLMVGSGNVGLIVSYQLLQAGAKVAAIVEAMPRIGGYAVHASKVRRAGVPILTSTTIKEASGKDKVEKAIIVRLDDKFKQIKGTEQALDVDVICLAVGLSPLAELAWMAGCKIADVPELGGFLPIHNEDMQTTAEGIYAAGDLAGIEEASTAIEEGRLAGIAIAQSLGYIKESTAKEQKQVINARSEQLREGPFGLGRKKAKEELIRSSQRDATGRSLER